jgi:hypothetical protein
MVERYEDGWRVASGLYATTGGALAAVRVELEQAERRHLYPGMSDIEVDLEMFDRRVEQKLSELGDGANGSE